MEAINKKLLQLLFDKEAEIKELKDYIIQLQTGLQQVQNLYNKLYALHYPRNKRKTIKKRIKIGFK